MTVVDHRQGAELVGQVADRAQVRNRPVHGEHAVRDDQFRVRLLCRLELCPQVVHVVVGIAVTACFAQPDAVDNARVVQRVADDGVFRSEQRFEQAAVGVETRGVEYRVLGPQELADTRLEFLVDGLGAANEAHRRHAVAELVKRLVRRGDDLGVVGQPEVVVGAQIQDFCRIAVRANVYRCLLRAGDEALLLVQSLGLEGFGLRRERREEIGGHGGSRCCSGREIISRIRANTDARFAGNGLLSRP